MQKEKVLENINKDPSKLRKSRDLFSEKCIGVIKKQQVDGSDPIKKSWMLMKMPIVKNDLLFEVAKQT